MIKAVIYKNHDGDVVGFETKGHAGYDDSGRDIICSAVSMLVINTVNSIELFTDAEYELDSDDSEDNSHIALMITSHLSNEAEVLLKALELGLSQTAQGNAQYMSITCKEV